MYFQSVFEMASDKGFIYNRTVIIKIKASVT